MEKAYDLRQQIEAVEDQLQRLKAQLSQAELEVQSASTPDSKWPLTATEYQRYGRQMIIPEIGLKRQLRLKRSKALIVGVGGLGCPAAAYLAGAGVGTLGLMDGDAVEISNLHRQVVHSTGRIGKSKVDSACEYLQSYVVRRNYTVSLASDHIS